MIKSDDPIATVAAPESAPADSVQRMVSRLREKALRLQHLRTMASEQAMDAELAYEDLTRQCKEAWEEYHKARKQEPANNQAECVHPYTCGNDRTDEAHRKYQAEHGGDFGQLVAVEDGWLCPVCGYTQKLRMPND